MRTLITLFLIAACAMKTPARASNESCFDDQNLKNLQASSKQRGTLIYVWSPRMVYSVQNIAIASRAAATAGLDLVVLHDMRIPKDEFVQARQRYASSTTEVDLATPPFVSPLDQSKPLCSAQLIEREALRHFPTAFVITARGIHAQPVVGAMPFSAWISSLDQRMKQP
ncbi:hypothetical protein [Variovorax sp. PCZ-1]|uniref:hypothetical protein n=1 Tax=Variovorax sp. PCZ-1 TaxID=2835533 RepID=UPI001BD0ACAC|nr:hypothetical protein [Variovorax sp. PCZ-1]MBS7806113.1 hypothetical protein [Variovorax sp. PCZ-1]